MWILVVLFAVVAVMAGAFAASSPDESPSGEGAAINETETRPMSGGGVNSNGHDLNALHPELRGLLDWANQQPFTVVITSTERTVAEQTRLYAIGRTYPNPWTLPTPELPLGPTVAPSTDPAQHGRRADGYVHAFDFSWSSMHDADRLALVAEAEARGLVWGGRWRHPDLVHFETSFWRELGPAPTIGGVS